MFWWSLWKVIGTGLGWFCSRRLWIKRVAGLTSFTELFFVERIGGLGVAGSLGIDTPVGNGNGWRLNRLGWFCLRRLWIERVAGLFIKLVVVERDGLVDLFWRSR